MRRSVATCHDSFSSSDMEYSFLSAYDMLRHRNVTISQLKEAVFELLDVDPQILARVEVDGGFFWRPWD